MRIAALLFCAALLPAQRLSMFETHLASGKAAVQQSRYSEADRQLRAAITDSESLDPADPATPARTADALETLCDLDLLIGKYDEAISLEERAVSGMEKSLGPDSHDLAEHLNRLAGAYRAGSATPKAEPVLQRVLVLDIRVLGPDDARVSTDYDNLGSAYVEMHRMPEARAAYEKALATRINRLGPDHIEVSTANLNLAVLEEKDDKPKPARAYYEKALAIAEKKLGD